MHIFRLYQQLDEKDDEIQAQSQLAERLKQQMAEQEDLIKQSKVDYEAVQTDMARIQQENEVTLLLLRGFLPKFFKTVIQRRL